VPTIISLILACLFVFLAGFNVWNKLASPGKSARGARLWMQVHRAAGYTFTGMFVIFGYFMFLRLKGWAEELSPQLILHVGLALVLAPLILVKVLVARYQKAARGLLTALGVAIFVIAFSLVALNLSIHLLRAASPETLSVRTSAIVVLAVLASVTIAFFAKGKTSRPTGTPSLSQYGNPGLSNLIEPLNLTLARVEGETADAKTLRFLLPQGQQLAWRPGQFLTFEWNIDGRPVLRSYSISSSPTQAGFLEITAKRVEKGHVSQFLNDRARAGLKVKARGPYGKFCFDESKHRRIALIAAGSGITPIIAMLRYIDDLCIPVEATLIYCIRTEHDVFFKSELAALQDRRNGFRCVLTLSQPSAAWAGWKGRLRREILEREIPKPLESTFFLCGPPAFMDLGCALLKNMGVEPSQILEESFGGAVAAQTGSTLSPGLSRVEFARSAKAHNLSPGETLLQSSERNGVLIPSGCREGICGTCATKLLRGKVQMEREAALTDEQRSQGYILPCVSHPIGDVILDA
jgi:glycine betaine catabolism B